MTELLKKLCALDGVSGREDAVRDFIISEIADYCDYTVDKMGNIIAHKKGDKTPKNKIMIDAHTDEVGLIATYITDSGLIKFSTVGGINTECLLAQRVRFGETYGVIGLKPVHLTSEDERKKLPKPDSLYIDIGCSTREEAERYVSVGDTAVFDVPFCERDGFITARAIDDRAGCAVIIDLIKNPSPFDFYATFTVQEEVGTRGAGCAAFTVEPDFCLCLEATTASDIPSVENEKRVCLVGEGPVISFMDRGTLYDRELFELAGECGVKYQLKTAVAGGNNSSAISRSRGGVRTLAVSLPCRYIHSPSCCACVSDLKNVREMAKALIARLGDR